MAAPSPFLQPQPGLAVPTFAVTPPPPPPQGWATPPSSIVRPSAIGETPSKSHRDKVKKSGRKKRNRHESCSSSCDEDEDCHPCPPATQIFLCPPGNPAPQQYGDCGEGVGPTCPKCNCPKRPDAAHGLQGGMDPYNMCVQQCMGLQGGHQGAGRTQTSGHPSPQVCACCQKQFKRKLQSGKNPDCCCGSGSESKKKNRHKDSTLEGMMPATQQFIMFLQAYGLATALIKDRCRREEQREVDKKSPPDHNHPDRNQPDHRRPSHRPPSTSPPTQKHAQR